MAVALDASDASAEEEDGEDEPKEVLLPAGPELRYTTEISDAELAERWKSAPTTLGTISIGFVEEGRLINGRPFPPSDDGAWTLVSPDKAWATSETIDYVIAAARHTKALHPTALPLRVNNISAQEGGYLRPHHTHQNGRDVDLGFYYDGEGQPHIRAREKVINLEVNWDLLKSLITLGDVQVILLDRRVQAVLYDYALRAGEDRACWMSES
jgi:hypothetical protein